MTTPETKQVIAAMLKENTGRHFLDSGGENGRAWQRNQERNFADEEPATLDGSYGEISVTVNLYHWLVDRLEYCEDLTEKFEEWANASEDRKEMPWLALMEEWADEEMEATGLYGSDKPFTVNTYNHESLLSQTIQFTYFTLDTDNHSGAFVLLQIHGGADVRGGYTAPKIFQVTDYDGTSILDDQRATIYCNTCEGDDGGPCGHWDTDDGYHWYEEGSVGRGYTELGEYETTSEDDDESREDGKLHFTSDGKILCPHCGDQLHAGTWPAG